MLKKLFFAILIIAWCLVIFLLSNMTGSESGDASGHIIEEISTFACKVAYKVGIISKMPSTQSIKDFTVKMNDPLRKCAHAFEYFVLGLIIMFAMRKSTDVSIKTAFLVSIIGSFLYCLTDEFHQSLIAGRGPSFMDCLIDTTGAWFAGVFYIICREIYYHFNKKIAKRA